MMRSRQQTVRKRANATAQIEETTSLEDPYAQEAHPGPSTTTPTPSISDSESNASGTTVLSSRDPRVTSIVYRWPRPKYHRMLAGGIFVLPIMPRSSILNGRPLDDTEWEDFIEQNIPPTFSNYQLYTSTGVVRVAMERDPEYSGFENFPAIPPTRVDLRHRDRCFLIEGMILPGYITRIQVSLEINYRVRMVLMLFAFFMKLWGFCFAVGYGANYVGITIFTLVSFLYIVVAAFTKPEDTCQCVCGCS
ncbi:hypothetical protein TWF970_005673 [Orbilia oligospora]|uniref:Uncharacterized protein n=1 Tax=Orbilia oligospora TaxID=2813651 RepID=A0A7C8RJC7_ORBOL|nr:hypothetical protein TWF970_005673 [Orbilia oligospora]